VVSRGVKLLKRPWQVSFFVRRRRGTVEFTEAVQLLLAGSEDHRLVERAFAEFDRWLDWQGGTVGGVPRTALEVSFWEQSLYFRTEVPLSRPRIVTCLLFRVRDDDEGLSGRYQLLSGLGGEVFGEIVDLDGEVPFETLGRGAWAFYGAHHGYSGPVPRCDTGGDDGIPF
jgi:hypothetical protein